MTKRRRPAGSTIGSILVGVDQMILRDVPPAEELIAKARPVRGLSGQAPGFTVIFPADIEVPASSSGVPETAHDPAQAHDPPEPTASP